ncbi:MAG: tight adherence protein [Burkholderiales bacterium]|jgi:tight adherence protein C
MSITSMFYLVVIFAAVFGAAMMLLQVLLPGAGQRRLKSLAAGRSSTDAASSTSAEWVARISKASGPLARLSLPEDGLRMSSLRTRFMHAGLRANHVPTLFFAAKTLLAAALPALLLAVTGFAHGMSTNLTLVCALLAAAAGYYLPNLALNAFIRRRQRQIFENFPDALDLMTVCIEAGLSADAAIARVGQEMTATSPAVAEELHLVTLELRAGQSKEQALRNLGIRTGVSDVDALATMLIQAERFGTSIGDSLRVHAEHLRTRRRQLAEERAAKVALKMLMPLIFCIFPSLILIMLGPSFIQIGRVLMPSLAGQ